MSYPVITLNTKIDELPEFKIKHFTEIPAEHPTRQFFNKIFPSICQVLKFYFPVGIIRDELSDFYDNLSTDDIIKMSNFEDTIHFQIKGVRIEYCDLYGGHCCDLLSFGLRIKNDPNEGNIPVIDFMGGPYCSRILSFDISLKHNAPIYNRYMCFDDRLLIKDIPAEHVTEEVWKYCQYVLDEVNVNMPEFDFPKPDIKNVRLSFKSGKMTLNITDFPYSVRLDFGPGASAFISICKSDGIETGKWFKIEPP